MRFRIIRYRSVARAIAGQLRPGVGELVPAVASAVERGRTRSGRCS